MALFHPVLVGEGRPSTSFCCFCQLQLAGQKKNVDGRPSPTKTVSVNGGVWRVAFAFDPHRQAILLVCGDKSGGSERRFYRQLIGKADARFDEHLARLAEEERKKR